LKLDEAETVMRLDGSQLLLGKFLGTKPLLGFISAGQIHQTTFDFYSK